MYKVIELEIDPEISGDTGVFEVAWVEYPAIEQELMYFGKQMFYKAPEAVAAKACRAIKENEKRGNPAATQVGKVRGQQLCNRDEISLETIKRMKSYLERAKVYNSGNWDDKGTISWHLWGGQEGLDWVDRILKSEEDMGHQDFVKPGPTEDKDEFISRCIPYVIKEGKTPEQAAGQCYGMWDNREFATERVGFDWEVLKTPIGLRFFKNEMSKGSLPVIFIQGLPTKELIDFTNKYGISSTAINMYDTRNEKVDLVKVMGLKRHYDLDFNVRRDLGSLAVKFDYDVSGLPDYVDYPESGDTNSMMVEPILPPVLFEGCGCQDNFEGLEDACWEGYIAIGTKMLDGREVPNCVPETEFQKMVEEKLLPGQVGVIDSNPTFETITDAENHSIIIGCKGHHTHTTVEGNIVYMACDKHPEEEIEYALDEYSAEELEAYEILMEFKKTDPQKFAEFVYSIDGRTESQVKALKLKNPTIFFQYKRKVEPQGFKDRPECMAREDKFFRRLEIDMMRNIALKYGHNGQPYSKWLWKFGPNCIHAWRRFIVQENNFADMGWVEGQPGNAMLKETPNNGYYSARTKKKAEGMSSVSYMKNIECAFGDLCKFDFSKKTEQLFAAKEEERMIYTPLMIPNILIPRLDEVSQEKYYVKFTPDTIKNIRDKFMAELRNRKTNYEHSDKKFEDIVMVETWIVQGEKDKAYELGFTQEQIPFGTWMGAYKVLDTKEGNHVWNEYIKPGKVRGASVEGNFILNFSKIKSDEYLLEQVINILKQITD